MMKAELTIDEQKELKLAAEMMGGRPEDYAAAEREIRACRMGRALLDARLQAGLSAEEVAERMGITPEKLDEIEACYDAELSWGEICGYARAVGLNLSVLMGTAETEKNAGHASLRRIVASLFF